MNQEKTIAEWWALSPETAACVNCKHYYQHYVPYGKWNLAEPIYDGHCVYPRRKNRKPDDVCVHFERKQEKPPSQVFPGTEAHEPI